MIACERDEPLVADHPDTLEGWSVIGQPIAEQVGQHRVEVFFGWVPGLDQVVVNLRRVDGAYGRVAVGIRSGQDAFGLWEERNGLLEELDTVHV